MCDDDTSTIPKCVLHYILEDSATNMGVQGTERVVEDDYVGIEV